MKFSYLKLNEKTLRYYIECFKNNNNIKDADKVKWQFFQNKLPNDYVVIAIDDEKQRPAGIYAMSTIKFQINHRDYLAAQSLDTITDINYRGKGIFTSLANKIYQKGKKEHLELVYGFPNGNSIHGFTKKLGWENLDPVPFMIKPLNTKYFTKKIKWLPNVNLSFLDTKLNSKSNFIEEFSFPDKVNELWADFSENILVAVKRDREYLNWRYIKKPDENYRIIHSYDKDNTYNGFVVFCIKEKHKGKIAYIMDLIYKPSNKRAGKELLNRAIKEIKKNKADAILSWCFKFSPNYSAYKSCKFFNLPQKIRPIELHFGFRLLNSDNEKVLKNRNNWFLSYADSDTV